VTLAEAAPDPGDYYQILGQLKVAGPEAQHVEPDQRTVPWHTLRRLAMLGGDFVPPYRPITNGEITGIIQRSRERGGPTLLNLAQRLQASHLLHRHGLAEPGLRWDSCECRTPQVHLQLGGRAALRELGPGGMVPQEAGLGGRGLQLDLEPDLALWSGSWWLAVSPRLAGPLSTSGRTIDDAFLYENWHRASNRPAEGDARVDEAWRVTLPRAAIGVGLGSWALTAGVFPASVGPGLESTGLSLTAQAESMPQVVARRTAPFEWSGFMGAIDPDHLLMRVGVTSEQTIRYTDDYGKQRYPNEPLFFQWLITWNHTSWWRTTVTHTAMAAPRQGNTLWGDIFQINFPLLSATQNEMDYGPVTDRIFTLGMEARFREAPWPLLPSAAGRVWWEYGGEDFNPSGTIPGVPQISAPASQAGFELVDHRWDLGVEFLETQHPEVLWYSNSGLTEGYTNEGVVLGHELGGGCQAWTALIRLRPDSGLHEWVLRGRTARWDMPRRLPTTAQRHELSLSWRRLTNPGAWTLSIGWIGEETAGLETDWLQGGLERRF